MRITSVKFFSRPTDVINRVKFIPISQSMYARASPARDNPLNF